FCSRRSLHSFPTRRSSDLVVLNYGASRARVAGEDVIAHFFTLFFITISTYLPPYLFSGSTSSWHYGTQNLIELQNGYHAEKAHLDRKSTRLNSSHQIISYA